MAVRLPDMTFVDPFGGLTDLAPGCCARRCAREQSFGDDPLRMMRAARFASQLGFDGRARGASRRSPPWPSRIAIVSAERVRDELSKLLLGADPRAGLELLVDTGLAAHVLPELPALRLEIDEHHRHKDVYEHSLIVLDQAIALETGPDGAVPGPTWCCGSPPCCTTSASRRRAGSRRAAASASTTTRWSARSSSRKRLKALRFDKATVQAVARLVELHLRFHGYGEGDWTDSAVRRYVTDAGPLLERLHRLTRSDCTTRNLRKAARLVGDVRRPGGADRRPAGAGGAAADPPGPRRRRRSWSSSASRPAARSASLQAPARAADGARPARPGPRRGRAARVVGPAARVRRRRLTLLYLAAGQGTCHRQGEL